MLSKESDTGEKIENVKFYPTATGPLSDTFTESFHVFTQPINNFRSACLKGYLAKILL